MAVPTHRRLAVFVAVVALLQIGAGDPMSAPMSSLTCSPTSFRVADEDIVCTLTARDSSGAPASTPLPYSSISKGWAYKCEDDVCPNLAVERVYPTSSAEAAGAATTTTVVDGRNETQQRWKFRAASSFKFSLTLSLGSSQLSSKPLLAWDVPDTSSAWTCPETAVRAGGRALVCTLQLRRKRASGVEAVYAAVADVSVYLSDPALGTLSVPRPADYARSLTARFTSGNGTGVALLQASVNGGLEVPAPPRLVVYELADASSALDGPRGPLPRPAPNASDPAYLIMAPNALALTLRPRRGGKAIVGGAPQFRVTLSADVATASLGSPAVAAAADPAAALAIPLTLTGARSGWATLTVELADDPAAGPVAAAALLVYEAPDATSGLACSPVLVQPGVAGAASCTFEPRRGRLPVLADGAALALAVSPPGSAAAGPLQGSLAAAWAGEPLGAPGPVVSRAVFALDAGPATAAATVRVTAAGAVLAEAIVVVLGKPDGTSTVAPARLAVRTGGLVSGTLSPRRAGAAVFAQPAAFSVTAGAGIAGGTAALVALDAAGAATGASSALAVTFRAGPEAGSGALALALALAGAPFAFLPVDVYETPDATSSFAATCGGGSAPLTSAAFPRALCVPRSAPALRAAFVPRRRGVPVIASSEELLFGWWPLAAAAPGRPEAPYWAAALEPLPPTFAAAFDAVAAFAPAQAAPATGLPANLSLVDPAPPAAWGPPPGGLLFAALRGAPAPLTALRVYVTEAPDASSRLVAVCNGSCVATAAGLALYVALAPRAANASVVANGADLALTADAGLAVTVLSGLDGVVSDRFLAVVRLSLSAPARARRLAARPALALALRPCAGCAPGAAVAVATPVAAADFASAVAAGLAEDAFAGAALPAPIAAAFAAARTAAPAPASEAAAAGSGGAGGASSVTYIVGGVLGGALLAVLVAAVALLLRARARSTRTVVQVVHVQAATQPVVGVPVDELAPRAPHAPYATLLPPPAPPRPSRDDALAGRPGLAGPQPDAAGAPEAGEAPLPGSLPEGATHVVPLFTVMPGGRGGRRARGVAAAALGWPEPPREVLEHGPLPSGVALREYGAPRGPAFPPLAPPHDPPSPLVLERWAPPAPPAPPPDRSREAARQPRPFGFLRRPA